jgi:hypothetical protein
MSESHADHVHAHGALPPPAPFRFEAFADAPSAQAAFDTAYPAGSPIAAVLQALVDMGAHCKAAGPARFVCRYLETKATLAGWCWQLVLEAGSGETLQRARIGVALTGL